MAILSLTECEIGKQYDREDLYAASDEFFENKQYIITINAVSDRAYLFKNRRLICRFE